MHTTTLLHILLFSLCLCAHSTAHRFCHHRATFPHASVPIPFARSQLVHVRLHVHYPCRYHRRRRTLKRRPLLLLLPGGLIFPTEYSRLVHTLLRRRFVVALPDYTNRDLRALLAAFPVFSAHFQAIQAITQCTRDLQLVTASVAASALKHLKSRSVPRPIRRTYTLRKVILFGHSLGGGVAYHLTNNLCASVVHPIQPPPQNVSANPQFNLRLSCEQFRHSPPRVNILGVVNFEGASNRAPGNFPDKLPFVEINSPFNVPVSTALLANKTFDDRHALVVVGNANHFGPNDFVKENDNQKAVCAVPRPPPENIFVTTEQTQRRVVRTVARIARAAYRSFIRGDWKPLKALVGKDGLLVESVDVL